MKRKLLSMALLAISALGFHANAQDVTSTYLTNPDFEGTYESYRKPSSDRDIYQPEGWIVEYNNGDSNDMTALDSESTSWESTFSKLPQPENGGNKTYWIRFRWGDKENLTIYQQTNKALPAGLYSLSADAYKNANGTAQISVEGESVTIDKTDEWQNYSVQFTVAETKGVTVSYSFVQNSQVESIAGVDNFKLSLIEPFVSASAQILPKEGGTMEADIWYAFDLEKAGEYTINAATLEDVVYLPSDGLASTAVAAPATIDVAAGTIYLKSSSAQVVTVTLTKEGVQDGVYYLYDENSKGFLSRGNGYGTEASLDKYGIPFTWTYNAGRIEFLDWENGCLYIGNNNYNIYTDGANPGWNLVDADGRGYYLQNADKTKYVTHSNGDYGEYVHFTDEQSEATVWVIKSPAEHDVIVNAYPADNKQNVIDAASLSTSPEDFETYLNTNYAAKDMTDKVGTARFAGSKGDWTWNVVRAQDGQPAYGTDWAEAYQATGSWTQTIAGLSKGIYKVTVNAFEREAGFAKCNELGALGYEIVTAYFAANNEQVQLKSWYSEKEGESNPNNTDEAAIAFNNDKYKNEVYVYVGEDGNLALALAKPAYVGGSWVLCNNFTLTFYSDEMSEDEISALLASADEYLEKPMFSELKSAISDAKDALESSHTIANYNALKTAIDNSQTSVDSYANMYTNYIAVIADVIDKTNVYTEEAKAAYDENVKKYNEGTITNAEANNLTITERYNSPVNNFLMPSWKIGDVAATTNESGFYQNYWSVEAENEEDDSEFYTPFFEYWTSDGNVLGATTLSAAQKVSLANGAYKVTAWVRVRETDDKTKEANGIQFSVGEGSPVDVVSGTQINTTNRAQFYIGEYTAYGYADNNGILTIKFDVAANSNISWLSFKNVMWEAVESVTASVSEIGYATFSSEFALDLAKIDGGTAYIVADEAAEDGSLKLTEQTEAVEAGIGLLIAKENGGTVTIPVATEGTAPSKNYLVAGKGEKAPVGSYVLSCKYAEGGEDLDLSTVGFYAVEDDQPVVEKGKAYLDFQGSTVQTKALYFVFGDGNATAIETTEAVEAAADGVLYNVAGQQVGKDYKGIVIKNGKKYLNK